MHFFVARKASLVITFKEIRAFPHEIFPPVSPTSEKNIFAHVNPGLKINS